MKELSARWKKSSMLLQELASTVFGEHFVAFRDNTKWQACVVSCLQTSWGGLKRPCFQNHAVTMSQDMTGNYITINEAHYICAILNAPIVKKYLFSSSDSRSFKIRPPVYIPKYNHKRALHKQLAALSKLAHKHYDDAEIMADIDSKIDRCYIALCRQSR